MKCLDKNGVEIRIGDLVYISPNSYGRVTGNAFIISRGLGYPTSKLSFLANDLLDSGIDCPADMWERKRAWAINIGLSRVAK